MRTSTKGATRMRGSSISNPPQARSRTGSVTAPRALEELAAQHYRASPSPLPMRARDFAHGSRSMSECRSASAEGPSPGGVVLGLTAADVEALLDENEKLRLVEREFWGLLHEREELQSCVEALERSGSVGQRDGAAGPADTVSRRVETLLAADPSVPSRTASTAPREHAASPTRDAQQRQRLAQLEHENETLRLALHESMELMIAEHVAESPSNTIRTHGPVCEFLQFTSMKHDRYLMKLQLENAKAELESEGLTTPRGGSARTRGGGSPARERHDQKAMALELKHAQGQVRYLQEELDRTDASRQQALDDAEAMRIQMEALARQLQEVKQALAQVTAAGDNRTTHGTSPGADKHKLRASVSRIERERALMQSELAQDTDRIRREFSRRSTSRGRSDEVEVYMDEI